MRPMLVSAVWVLNKETWKFEKLSSYKGSYVVGEQPDFDVPDCIWSDFWFATLHNNSVKATTDALRANVLTHEGRTFWRVDEIEFNNLLILTKYADSYTRQVTLMFPDKVTGQEMSILINADGFSSMRDIVLDYTLSTDNRNVTAVYKWGDGHCAGRMTTFFADQVTVYYHNKKLNGSCYAVVFGAIAVLLDDELRFDAVVALESMRDMTLGVRKIIYTSNSYLTKAMMLIP